MTFRALQFVPMLMTGLLWSAAATSESPSENAAGQLASESAARPTNAVFAPIDAEALIEACANAAAVPAADSAADEARTKIAYVKCLRESIIDQHSALVAGHLAFAEREGADMEEKRSYWRGRAEWLADETRSCIPSCQPAERAERYIFDRAADVGESVLRDFVAERNVYEDGARRFSESDDASNLGPACWDISDNMRDTGIVTMMRWGIARTAVCIEYVILDQVEVVFEPRFLSRKDMRKKLDDVSEGYQTFYWLLYNEHRGCGCEAHFNTRHLRAYAELLREMLRDLTRQRQEYGL